MLQLGDHLSILGLTESASTTELQAAYRREIFKWHPDRFHGDPANEPAATERAKRINAAFEYLSELHENGSLPRSTSSASGHQQSRPQPQQTYRTQHTYKGTFTPGFPDPSVFEVFVKSSAFISAGYDPSTRTLYLKFVGNRVYSYLNVPESVFTAFISAESHGKFADRHILHQYKYVPHESDAKSRRR
jgi:curved DNA-binding protein CbpA